MNSITFDEKTINDVNVGSINVDPLVEELELPYSCDKAKCVQIEEHGYVLSRNYEPEDSLLTISLKKDGPLYGLDIPSRRTALKRIVACTYLTLEGKPIPKSYNTFHRHGLFTFHADNYNRGQAGIKEKSGRIVMTYPTEKPRHFVAFLMDYDVKDISTIRADEPLAEVAKKFIAEAASSKAENYQLDNLNDHIALKSCKYSSVEDCYSLDEWYTSRLTSDQLQFVNYDKGSVRLVGPPGSGKTIALVIRCIKDLKEDIQKDPTTRFIFLTHAASTVDLVVKMISEIEPDLGAEFLASDNPPLQVTTLHELANAQMKYELHNLTPVSLDGYEGRAFQADILNSVIGEYRTGNWGLYKGKCSSHFLNCMTAEPNSYDRKYFLWEILNEFACVLDANNVRSGAESREKYKYETRKKWMMPLEEGAERQVVLDLYDMFRAWLRKERAIGSDQMITDFLNHLDSFKWEANRDTEGCDKLFVDELHLFNRQERMTFSHLFRRGEPLVYMAYDSKQSPRDTFLGLPEHVTEKYNYRSDKKIGKAEKIELVDIFRYSPQIARVLKSIDQSFPGQDLDDEWPEYKGIAQTQDGPVPTLYECDSVAKTYGMAFKRATELQLKLGMKGRVAVLCASNELFKHHLMMPEKLKTPKLAEAYKAITSRDQASKIPRSKKKFIFSMPEYVAGLQFDTVIVIEVNEAEVPKGAYSMPAKRKFVSQIYLGASRAIRCLEFFSSKDQGGTSSLLNPAIENREIVVVSTDKLKK